jgi:glutamate-1-semialdehyde 2,1-aminomutase
MPGLWASRERQRFARTGIGCDANMRRAGNASCIPFGYNRPNSLGLTEMAVNPGRWSNEQINQHACLSQKLLAAKQRGVKLIMEQNEWLQFASHYLPGGVCSSARVHKALNRPIYISRAEGSRVYDLAGHEYIDLFMSFGAGLLGHGNPQIKEAIQKALDLGFPAAYENVYQGQLAQKIAAIVPCAEMVRFTLSGTETTWYAVRIARQFTGRPKILKFEGHFHGFNDYLAYNCWPAPQEVWPAVTPAIKGIPEACQKDTLVLPFNNLECLEETLAKHGHEIAAVILEPLNYNSGTIEPLPGYLQRLRELTQAHGSLLIFDEILSNFRTGPGCIQAYYGVTPDLCTLGKVLAGGLALSAIAGRREIMSQIAPSGEIQHSGTYNALWIPVMAGLAFIETITQPAFYAELLPRCDRFYAGVNEIMRRRNYRGRVKGIGARGCFLFGPLAEQERLVNYGDFVRNDWSMALDFYRTALEHGLYMHSAHHHGISAMHSDDDIDLALERIDTVVQRLPNK